MPDSKISQIELSPRPLGITVILVTAMAFVLGLARNELALSLLGAVFLIILIYCLLGVLLLGIIHRRKASLLSMAIIPDTLNAGEEAEFVFKSPAGAPGGIAGNPSPGEKFFSLPAIIVRCELSMGTLDGRVIRHYADPGAGDRGFFPVAERGAYYSGFRSPGLPVPGSTGPRSALWDRLVVFDGPGFFRLTLPLGQGPNPRLLALPRPAEEKLSFSLKSGGAEVPAENHYQKSDSLTDHRPYVPGDDPRRINWKLYSHAPLGDLFVREGEPRPPPHSQLIILIDGETDPSLYSPEEGRRGVDILCENALRAAQEFSARGMDIQVGWTEASGAGDDLAPGPRALVPGTEGSSIPGARDASLPSHSSAPLNSSSPVNSLAPGGEDISAALARPYSIRPGGTAQAELAPLPADRAVLILALPRTAATQTTEAQDRAGMPASSALQDMPVPSALDRFLSKREAGLVQGGTDIVFIFDREGPRARDLAEAAGLCVRRYNYSVRGFNIHASSI